MSLSVETAMQVAQAVLGLDFSQELARIESGNVVAELTTVEDVANAVAAEVPDAKYVADLCEFLVLIAKLQAAGLIAPADPQTDQAMINAAGHGGLGQSHT